MKLQKARTVIREHEKSLREVEDAACAVAQASNNLELTKGAGSKLEDYRAELKAIEARRVELKDLISKFAAPSTSPWESTLREAQAREKRAMERLKHFASQLDEAKAKVVTIEAARIAGIEKAKVELTKELSRMKEEGTLPKELVPAGESLESFAARSIAAAFKS